MTKYLPLWIILTFMISGCSTMYAHVTYDFNQLENNGHIYYENGARESANKVNILLPHSIKQVVNEQYLGFESPESINIYIFNDEQHFAAYGNTSIKARGSSTTDDVFLSPIIGDNKDTLYRILTHELSHVHMRQYIGTWNSITNIPTWFDEGLAVATSNGGGAEKVTESEAIDYFKNGKHFIPVTRTGIFSHKYAHDYVLNTHMFYRQSGMFVTYLKRVNPDAFRQCYLKITEGEDFSVIWKKYYGKAMPELWAGFLLSIGA